jgi:hypothetical protein
MAAHLANEEYASSFREGAIMAIFNFGGLNAQFGKVNVRQFASSGKGGDWQEYTVTFDTTFQTDNIVVVAAATRDGVAATINSPAVVAMAWDVTRTGFTLAGRNSDIAAGQVAFSWLAVEVGSVAIGESMKVRPLALQPLPFNKAGTQGDWGTWTPGDATPILHGDHPLATLLTATDPPDDWLPIVGVATATDLVMARNSIGIDGGSAMNVLWILDTAGGGRYLAQAGTTSAKFYNPDGEFSSGFHLFPDFDALLPFPWQAWFVYFPVPFVAPPTVFVTAGGSASGGVAVAGMVFNVNSTGFYLVSHLTDSTPGSSTFNWVAVGCRGCF